MTLPSSPSPPPKTGHGPAPTAASVVGPLRRASVAAVAVGGALWAAAAVAAGTAWVVLLDATVILSSGARHAFAWAVLAGLAAAVALTWRRQRRETPARVARRFEQADPAAGSQLVNAVQLADAGRGDDDPPLTAVLRTQAVELGRARASAIEPWGALRRGLRPAFVAAAAIAGVWLLAAVFAFPVLRAVAPRLLDPGGDHPPYSRVAIALDDWERTVLYGGQLPLRATLDGPPVEQLYLVAEPDAPAPGTAPAPAPGSAAGSAGAANPDDATPAVTRSPMFRNPDGSFSQALTGVTGPITFYVTDGRARTRRHRVEPLYTPKVELVELARSYPAYTRLDPEAGAWRDETLRLPLDTRLGFRVTSNRPLDAGELVLTPLAPGDGESGEPVRVAMARDAELSRVVAGGFTLAGPVAFEIVLRDADGLVSDDNPQGRVLIEPDRGPRLDVVAPGHHAVATPDRVIPVHVQARDDYGVEAVTWFRGLNRSIERPAGMAVEGRRGLDDRRRVDAKGGLDLADLGVRPGDTLEYFFEAVDNDPRGPNVATSRPFSLQIISHEAYRELLKRLTAQRMLFEQYRDLDRQAFRLAEQAAALAERAEAAEAEAAEADPELDADAEAFREAMAGYRETLERAIASEALFPMEQSFQASLIPQLARATAMEHALGPRGAGERAPPGERLAQMAEALGGQARAIRDEVSEPARTTIAVAELMRARQRFLELTGQQEELTRLSRRFSERSGDFTQAERMALQELAARQRAVADGLRELSERLPQRIAALPEGEAFDRLRDQATAFSQALRDAAIEPELYGAEESFAAADGESAHARAVEGHARMDALIGRCAGMPGSAEAGMGLCFWPSIPESTRGSTLDQIMAALGSQPGQNGPSGDGYSLFNESMGLYGPRFAFRPEAAMGNGPQADRAAAFAVDDAAARGGARDDRLPDADADLATRLAAGEGYPIEYRRLVGDYFRAIAEHDDAPEEPDR